MKRHYNITLVESAEGVAVWSDDLPGCCSQGRTRKEALANIKAAIRDYVAAQPEIARRFGAKVMHAAVAV